MSAGTKNTFLGPDIPHPSSSPVLHPNSLSPTPATDPPTPPSLLSVSWTLISMAATFLWMEESARGMGIEVPRRFLPWDEDSTRVFSTSLLHLFIFLLSRRNLDWFGLENFAASFLLICSLACSLCPSLIAVHPPAEMVKRKGEESRAGRERAGSVMANWKPREKSQMEFSQFDPLNLQTTPTSLHIKSDLSCRNPGTTVLKLLLFSCPPNPPPLIFSFSSPFPQFASSRVQRRRSIRVTAMRRAAQSLGRLPSVPRVWTLGKFWSARVRVRTDQAGFDVELCVRARGLNPAG